MPVKAGVVLALYFYKIAVAVRIAAVGHISVNAGADRRIFGNGDIYALVQLAFARDGVYAAAENITYNRLAYGAYHGLTGGRLGRFLNGHGVFFCAFS